jgi:butirosin biosynthesis protein H-like
MKFNLGLRPWRHELGNCLHACLGTVLMQAGIDPVAALGTPWGFFYEAGDFRREEYYYPCRPGQSLAEALAPYSGAGSRWHEPADVVDGWAAVRGHVQAGRPAIVAVDNFHLSFRPAYGDVHTNHLLVVDGFTDDEQSVHVVDPVPPAFRGTIPRAELDASRDSRNESRHDRDRFFADNPIRNRWLEVVIRAPRQIDDASWAGVRELLRRNTNGFTQQGQDGRYEGITGVCRFLMACADGLSRNAAVRDEAFIVAGVALAGAALHATYLRAAGKRFHRSALLEAAFMVDRIAHHWSALRIIVAAAQPEDAPRVRRRAQALVADHWRALEVIEDALERD